MKFLGRQLILFSIVVLGSIYLHSYRFHAVEYRQDEINTVHAASVLDTAGIVDWLYYEGTHPPGWRLFATEWIDTFGYQREIARFQSTLITALTLALTYRLGKDLYKPHIGLFASLFVGLLPYAQWHLHELRPYAPLIMVSAALQVIFLRWLYYRNWQISLIYITLGSIGLQIHYFAGFIILAHAIYVLIALEWNKKLFWQVALLGNLILASFVWWLPAIYHGTFIIREKGITYGTENNQESLTVFITSLNYAPMLLFPLILWGKNQIGNNRYRVPDIPYRRDDWQRMFLFIVPIGIFFTAFIANNFVLLFTFRNMSVILPLLGVIFGVVLQGIHRYVQWLSVAVFILVSTTTFIYYAPQVPHSEMETFINQDIASNDKFILSLNVKGATAPAALYYFSDHLNTQPSMARFFIINELNANQVGFKYDIDPFPYEVANDTYTAEDLEAFENFLRDTNHIYYIEFRYWELEKNIYTLRPRFDEILLANFEPSKEKTWPVQDHDPNAGFTIIEYRRKQPYNRRFP